MKVYLAIFFVCLLASTAYSNSDYNTVVYKAQRELKAGNCSGAIKIIEGFLDKNPQVSNPAVYLLLGDAYSMCKRFARACISYREGFRLAPSDSRLCVGLARTEFELKRFADAGVTYGRCAKLVKKKDARDELLFSAALAFERAGLYRTAMKIAEKITGNSNTSSKRYLLLLLQTSYKAGRWNNAEKALFKILDRSPMDEKFWNLLASVERKRGNLVGMVAALEIASFVKRSIGNVKRLAQTYEYLGLLDRAGDEYRILWNLQSIEPDYEKLVKLYTASGNFDKALLSADEAIRRGKSALLDEKGRILLRIGDVKKAIETFEMARKNREKDLQARFWLAYALFKQGDWNDAHRILLEACDICSSHAKKSAVELCRDISQLKAIVENLSITTRKTPRQSQVSGGVFDGDFHKDNIRSSR